LSGLGDIAHEYNQQGYRAQEEYDAETKYGIPHGVLAGSILPLPAHSQPGQAEQIAKRLSDLHADDDPDWGAAVDELRNQFGITNVGPILDAGKANTGADSSPKARAIAASKPTAFNSSSPGAGQTSVRIDELNVYSAAQDATGIAGDLDNALQRKLTVSLADGALS
jgi:hypothetical protein